jgi:hypothetical protein
MSKTTAWVIAVCCTILAGAGIFFLVSAGNGGPPDLALPKADPDHEFSSAPAAGGPLIDESQPAPPAEAGGGTPAAGRKPAKFVTLFSPDDSFKANGVTQRFPGPGFYGITVQEAGGEQFYSVFVSPIPSVHAAAVENYDWYRTQFNTGTTSNCGPASVSMAIGWSMGKDFPVSAVRETVGWQGEGGTSFEELIRVIKDQGIPAAIVPLKSVQHIKDVINSGSIAVVLFRTGGVSTTTGNVAQNLFGKYYDDSVGHYIVIKGYSVNGEYFVIYDPIPSDWGYNSFRYDDGLSMIGRNRYYSSEELLGSLRRAEMIVIPKVNTAQ